MKSFEFLQNFKGFIFGLAEALKAFEGSCSTFLLMAREALEASIFGFWRAFKRFCNFSKLACLALKRSVKAFEGL